MRALPHGQYGKQTFIRHPNRGGRAGRLALALVALSLLGGTVGCTLAGRAVGASEPGWAGLQPSAGGPGDLPGGDPERGRQLIRATYGCGACHVIPGVAGAYGKVGPPLDFWAERVYIAGNLPNQPPYLVRWLRDPQAVEPGTAMPNLGVTEIDARDIAAYLYTLR